MNKNLIIGGVILGGFLLFTQLNQPQQQGEGGGGFMVIPGQTSGYLSGEAMRTAEPQTINYNIDMSVPDNVFGDGLSSQSNDLRQSDAEAQATGTADTRSPSRSSGTTTASGAFIPLTQAGVEAQQEMTQREQPTQFISPAQATGQSMLSLSPLGSVQRQETQSTPNVIQRIRDLNRARLENPLKFIRG